MAGSLSRGLACGCALGLSAMALLGCGAPPEQADLGRIYNRAAQADDDGRNPVIVIPGILGSRLERADGLKVWGSFTFGAADADRPEGARAVAVPMRLGVPLSELRDDVIPAGVLDVIVADVTIFRGLEFGAYVDILRTLGVGGYRDDDLGSAGAIDYGGLHSTCYQFGYDWRRDISETAGELDLIIREAQDAIRAERELRPDEPVRVDVVAHSMGGMVLRYYLRYGATPLPDDGSLPELTWAGAAHVERAVLVGTPNAGSALSLSQLVEGWDLNPLFPNYRSSVLGTMPAIYQLLPRVRHARVVSETSGEPVDLYDPGVWETYSWGLADPGQDFKLRHLLPDVTDADERREIALDHQRKALARAAQLHRALDLPATPPAGTTLSLFAGDSRETPDLIGVSDDGRLTVKATAPGDGTVTRASAVLDERVGGVWSPRLQTPITWDRVQFLFTDHIGLTRAPTFADNVLWLLLEAPRERRIER